ncbi:MAG: hemerythrin domain-containing protein [Phycisphaeraceae bacterium]|nr:hemerythrin domain-containing protein [Phycisphaeraceae bacterium]
MPKFMHEPLKRHQALQPFSRDHYQGLVQSQHLIKAADSDAIERRKALAEFLDVWEREIEPHFQDEEQLLADLVGNAKRAQLLQEHRRLREFADEARARRRQIDPQAQWMRNLGQSLHAHIRWEERELFTSLESDAKAKLDTLRPEASRIEAFRPRSRNRGRMES